MRQLDTRRLELGADIFKALGHPMRLAMLDLLNEKPWCVCELAEELGLGKSVASKHLSQLYDVGLLHQERQGTQVIYSLIAPCVVDMAACCHTNALLELRRRLSTGAVDPQGS